MPIRAPTCCSSTPMPWSARETIDALRAALLAEPDLASVGPCTGRCHRRAVARRVALPVAARHLGRGGRPRPAAAQPLRHRVGAAAAPRGPRARRRLRRRALLPLRRGDRLGAPRQPARLAARGRDRLHGPPRRCGDEHRPDARARAHFHASQELYLRKHFGALGWQVARAGQVAGSAVRGVLLRGERRRAARRRARLYLAGPARPRCVPPTPRCAAAAAERRSGRRRRERVDRRAGPRDASRSGLAGAAVVSRLVPLLLALGRPARGHHARGGRHHRRRGAGHRGHRRPAGAHPACWPCPCCSWSCASAAGGIDLSLSDFALAAAAVPALFLARRPFSPGLRAVLWASAVYQFATLITVVNNPYAANAVEWAHAWMLVSGALLVGWAVGANGHGADRYASAHRHHRAAGAHHRHRGRVHFAQGTSHRSTPPSPTPCTRTSRARCAALGAVMVYARPDVGRASPGRWSILLMTLMLAAVLFTQSRQAVIGLVAPSSSSCSAPTADRRRSKLVLLLAAPLVALRDQPRAGPGQVGQPVQLGLPAAHVVPGLDDRLETDPWFGVGLRWWYTDRFPFQFQPPNAEIEVLTSAGVLGLAAFVAAHGRLPAGRVEARPGLRLAGRCRARVALVQGQFDLFWAAVQGSLPFVVLGLCLGVRAGTPRSDGIARRDAPEV